MHMITANLLTDGRVVFMDASGNWVTRIQDGAVFDSEAGSEQSLAAAARAVEECKIVEPYLIDVLVENGERRPAQVREVIRAFGPSVRTDLSG